LPWFTLRAPARERHGLRRLVLIFRKSVFSGAWHRRRKDKVSIRRQLKRRYVLAFFQKLQACLVGIESRAKTAGVPGPTE
jgi:hypothetical protein